jgi:hypothetical protein
MYFSATYLLFAVLSIFFALQHAPQVHVKTRRVP